MDLKFQKGRKTSNLCWVTLVREISILGPKMPNRHLLWPESVGWCWKSCSVFSTWILNPHPEPPSWTVHLASVCATRRSYFGWRDSSFGCTHTWLLSFLDRLLNRPPSFGWSDSGSGCSNFVDTQDVALVLLGSILAFLRQPWANPKPKAGWCQIFSYAYIYVCSCGTKDWLPTRGVPLTCYNVCNQESVSCWLSTAYSNGAWFLNRFDWLLYKRTGFREPDAG